MSPYSSVKAICGSSYTPVLAYLGDWGYSGKLCTNTIIMGGIQSDPKCSIPYFPSNENLCKCKGHPRVE